MKMARQLINEVISGRDITSAVSDAEDAGGELFHKTTNVIILRFRDKSAADDFAYDQDMGMNYSVRTKRVGEFTHVSLIDPDVSGGERQYGKLV